MSYSESKHIEYRLVWPNGELYANVTKADANRTQDDINAELQNLSVPREYWPHRVARIVKTINGEWLPYKDVETAFNNDEEDSLILPPQPKRPYRRVEDDQGRVEDDPDEG